MATAVDSRAPSPTEARSRAQSTSASARTRDGEAPKMKGTCDRCALSKVKCDRQLPHCARCVTIGNELGIPPPCHYTVSLRSLRKASGKKQGESSRKAKTRHVRSETLSTCSGEGDDLSMAGSRGSRSPDPRPSITSHPSFDQSAFFDFDMKMDATGEPDSYFPQQTPTMAFAGKDFGSMADNMLYPNFMPRQTSCSTAPSTVGGDDLFSGASSTFAEHHMSEPPQRRPSCADLVCLTVHELWRASRKSSCSMTAPTIPQALDEALMLNRTASDAVTTVMNCSCAHNPEFFFNAAFLLHSLMGFFRSIVHNALPPRQPGQQHHHPAPPSQDMQFLQAMGQTSSGTSTPNLGTPMRLGVYTMSPEDEHAFKVQLLRSEVARVSRLIDDFVAKYCSWPAADDFVTAASQQQPQQPPPQPGQAEMLKYCLSMELKQCLDELDARACWL